MLAVLAPVLQQCVVCRRSLRFEAFGPTWFIYAAVWWWCGGGHRGGCRGHILEGCRYHGKNCPDSTWQHSTCSLPPLLHALVRFNTFSCCGYAQCLLISIPLTYICYSFGLCYSGINHKLKGNRTNFRSSYIQWLTISFWRMGWRYNTDCRYLLYTDYPQQCNTWWNPSFIHVPSIIMYLDDT